MRRRGGFTRQRRRWAPELPAFITFKPYGENERGSGGYSYGGYVVFWHGIEIGKLARHYPTWDRKPKGLRYVTARGVSHTPVWRIDHRALDNHDREYRTRVDAVEALLEAWQEKYGVRMLKTRWVRVGPETEFSKPHEIDDEKLSEFIKAKLKGEQFPPVRLVEYPSGMMIIDGHHRVTACETIEHSFDAIVASGEDFEQLDLDLKDAGIDKRADDIEFWVLDPAHYCVSCGAGGTVTESIEEQTFPVGCAPDPVIDVTCDVPVMTCSECQFQWTDHRGEEIRDKAAREQTPYFSGQPA